MRKFKELLEAVKEGTVYHCGKSGNGSTIILTWDSKEPDSILVKGEGDPFYIAENAEGKTYAWWWEAQGSQSGPLNWEPYSKAVPMNAFKYDKFFLVIAKELEEELTNIIYKEFDDVRALMDAGLPVRLFPDVEYTQDEQHKPYLSLSLGWSYGKCLSGSKVCYVLSGLNIDEFYYEMEDNDPYYGYCGDIICQYSIKASGKGLQVSQSVWPNCVDNNLRVVEK